MVILLIFLIILYIIIRYIITNIIFNPPLLATYDRKFINFIYNKIAIKFFEKNSNKIILFSHNNADDIGICKNYCLWLSNITNINVLVYDYIGYGLSYNDSLNEYNLLKSAKKCYNFIVKKLKYKPENIYLYGKSLGTVPTIYLSQYKNAGVLLIAPLASGARLYLDVEKYNYIIKFILDYLYLPSILRIKKSTSKIGIIHGYNDKLIPIENSYCLIKKIKKENYYKPLYVNAGHNNIEIKHTEKVTNYIKKFINNFQ